MTGSLQTKQLKSGKSYYYVRLSYKDRFGKWCTKTVATHLEIKNNKRKAEALINTYIEQYAYLEELPSEYNRDISPDISLCDYMDYWLEGKKGQLKRSTYEGYIFRVKRIKQYFEEKNLRLVDVTPKILDSYFKYALQYGKVNQKTKEHEPLSVRSVRSYKSILYSVFSDAMINGIVKQNPVAGLTVYGKKSKEYSEEYLFMTEEEISELLHFLSQYYPRLLGIAFFAAYYGLRRSEILGLKWKAVDDKKRTITINHTVVRVKTIQADDSTKSQSGRRTLNLFPTAESCLQRIRDEQTINKKFYKNDYKNQDGYIFTWEDGSQYDPNYISQTFGKATKAFGRPEITLHKLRHSCASMLINKGWDIKKLQYWLGHTDTQTTLNIYSHFNKQRLNTSENDLSEISMATADLFA